VGHSGSAELLAGSPLLKLWISQIFRARKPGHCRGVACLVRQCVRDQISIGGGCHFQCIHPQEVPQSLWRPMPTHLPTDGIQRGLPNSMPVFCAESNLDKIPALLTAQSNGLESQVSATPGSLAQAHMPLPKHPNREHFPFRLGQHRLTLFPPLRPINLRRLLQQDTSIPLLHDPGQQRRKPLPIPNSHGRPQPEEAKPSFLGEVHRRSRGTQPKLLPRRTGLSQIDRRSPRCSNPGQHPQRHPCPCKEPKEMGGQTGHVFSSPSSSLSIARATEEVYMVVFPEREGVNHEPLTLG
jgi:hypothetical protein